MTETAKICLPALIYTLQNNLYYIALSHLEATTFCVSWSRHHCLHLSFLVIFVYVGQRALPYAAALKHRTFQIAYQMKIFTTALLMYIVLGKRLSYKQWIALALLVIGITFIDHSILKLRCY